MPSAATAGGTWSSPATQGTPNPQQLRNAGHAFQQARTRRPARTPTLSILPATAVRSLQRVNVGADDDRAGGAGHDVLADRPEQHPREAAAAAAADGEQGRIRRGVEQDLRGMTLHDALGHPIRVGWVHRLSDGLLQRAGGIAFPVEGQEHTGPIDPDVRDPPGDDRIDRLAGEPRLAERPAQRLLRVRRAVHADDDAAGTGLRIGAQSAHFVVSSDRRRGCADGAAGLRDMTPALIPSTGGSAQPGTWRARWRSPATAAAGRSAP